MAQIEKTNDKPNLVGLFDGGIFLLKYGVFESQNSVKGINTDIHLQSIQ